MGNRICGRRSAVEERFLRPQRVLRQPSNLDYKKLRRLIRAEKLAPCFDGEDEARPDLEECPICFLNFPSLNRSSCCSKGICTECFLQMKPNSLQVSAQCPFCKASSYAVEYRGARSDKEKALEKVEEQKVIEAKLRMQSQDSRDVNHAIERDSNLPLDGNADADADDSLPSSSGIRDWAEIHADCEDRMVMEAIWRSLKDPKLWSNGILDAMNLEISNVPMHPKEEHNNSRVVSSNEFLEQLGVEHNSESDMID